MKQIIKNFLFKKRLKLLKNNKGFSLMELLVVVGIMGVISALAIPAYNKYNAKANETGAKAEAKTILRAIQTCIANGDGAACANGTVNNTISKTCIVAAGSAAKATQILATATTNTCYLFVDDNKACALSNIKGKSYCMDNSGGSDTGKYCEHATVGKGTCKT